MGTDLVGHRSANSEDEAVVDCPIQWMKERWCEARTKRGKRTVVMGAIRFASPSVFLRLGERAGVLTLADLRAVLRDVSLCRVAALELRDYLESSVEPLRAQCWEGLWGPTVDRLSRTSANMQLVVDYEDTGAFAIFMNQMVCEALARHNAHALDQAWPEGSPSPKKWRL